MSKYSFNFKGRKSQFSGVLKVKLNPASVGKLLKELASASIKYHILPICILSKSHFCV